MLRILFRVFHRVRIGKLEQCGNVDTNPRGCRMAEGFRGVAGGRVRVCDMVRVGIRVCYTFRGRLIVGYS